MVTMTAKAQSNLVCRAVHGPSGTMLTTDAPLDVGGAASSFSPTDLVSVGLLTCIMTTMGLVADRLGVDLTGMEGAVEKRMNATSPRRIAHIKVVLDIPAGVNDANRAKLEHAARHCPVHLSLHPETMQEIVINWNWS